jgi:hypothetical protein
MYPEDQSPQMNSLGAPPQPTNFGGQPEPPKKPQKSSINTKLIIIIGGAVLGLLMLIVLIVLAVNAVSNTSNNTGKQPNATANDETPDEDPDTTEGNCDTKQRRYQSRDLSLGFCYPNAWGDVKVQDAAFDQSDDGTRLRLSFSKKPQVNIGLVSDDWSTDAAPKNVCTDPAAQDLPNFESYSARWTTEASKPPVDKKSLPAITSASRGLEIATDQYIIHEHVDDQKTKGVCITGFNLTNGVVYRHAEASYYAPFNATVKNAQAHINSPTLLAPVTDRTDFLALVKSMYAL